MYKTSKHIINPDKLSVTLDLKWVNYKIPEAEVRDGAKYDEDQFIYNFPEKPLVLSFHNKDPFKVVLYSSGERENFTIRFGNITSVEYLDKQKLVIFESKDEEFFSQIWINNKGDFRMSTSVPIKDYKHSWSKVMKRNRGL